MDDKGYKDECDRLSELEAQNYQPTFGRWFLEDGMIKTWVCVPTKEIAPVKNIYIFQISPENYHSEWTQNMMWDYLTSKKITWLGNKGLKDLKRLFKYLSKKSGYGIINTANQGE